MASFSVSDAAGAGFQLIGRKPLSVFAWGLFAVVVGVLPIMGIMGASMGPMFDLMRETQLHPQTPPDRAAIMQVYSHMMFVNPLLRLLSLVVQTVLAAAVFRAVLEPRNSAFAYLRLGMQEVWIVLVTIVEAILIGIGLVCAILVAGVIDAVLFKTVVTPVAVIIAIVLGCAIFFGLIWIVLRLSMATLISFDDRKFRLFESWAFTRGQAGNLFLLALLLLVILILLEMVALGVLAVPAMIFIAPHMTSPEAVPAAMEAFFKQSPQAMLQSAAPAIVVFVLVFSLVIGAVHAIFMAPWAAAYKMLKPVAEAA
jgi:hypothetical protein